MLIDRAGDERIAGQSKQVSNDQQSVSECICATVAVDVEYWANGVEIAFDLCRIGARCRAPECACGKCVARDAEEVTDDQYTVSCRVVPRLRIAGVDIERRRVHQLVER